VGQRAVEFVTDGSGRTTAVLLPRFDTITYRELGERADAIAGALADVFGRDVTLAVMTCSGCHESAVIARAMVYLTAMGSVARCPYCDRALMVLGPGPDARIRFSMPGVSSLELTPDEPDAA
jgi:hypothetical protein